MELPTVFGQKLNSKGDTKGLVLALLNERYPLSITELNALIYKRYHAKLTYQAIRKCVRKLHAEGILAVHDKKYLICKDWLLRVKTYVDKLLFRYHDPSFTRRIRSSRALEQHATYRLNSLFDLDNFWCDVALEYCAALPVRTKLDYISITHYTWWMLINLGHETRFWRSIIERGMRPKMIILRTDALNKWAAGIYRDIGVPVKLIADKQYDETVEYNLIGDLVLQVTLSREAARYIQKFYAKHKSVNKVNLRAAEELAHKKFELSLSVFKDASLAGNLRRAYKI